MTERFTIEVRENDKTLLNEIAEQQWRTPEQQASALIEQALALHRSRASGTQRGPGRRAGERLTGGPRNGLHTAQPATAG